jgi:drug/metabolite transporter (DMT)-like permease
VPLFVVFVILWSSGFLVGKLGLDAAQPLGLLALRVVLAMLVAVPLALRVPGWRAAPFARLAVVGLLLQVVQFAGVYSGLDLGVHAAVASLIVLGLTPVVTTATATALGMEQPRLRTWVALVVGIAGVALSVAPDLGDAHAGPAVGLTVLGMLGLAFGSIAQKQWAADVDPRVSVAVQTVVASCALVPLAAVTGELDMHASFRLAWTVLWLAWPLSVGAVALLAVLLRRHDASTVSALLLTVPAVTALLAVPMLGDGLAPVSIVGMVVTLAAVATVVLKPAPAAVA